MKQKPALIFSILLIVASILSVHKLRNFGGLFLSLLFVILSNTISYMYIVPTQEE